MSDVELDTRTVRVERTYDAPAEAVFDAWTNPEVLRRWWGPTPEHRTPAPDVDLRVGGGYRLVTENPETGDTLAVFGEYREVSRPERLVYSWEWEGTGPYAGHESLVSVSFRPDGAERTTVVIEHTGLLDEQSSEAHGAGWAGALDNLASRIFPSAG